MCLEFRLPGCCVSSLETHAGCSPGSGRKDTEAQWTMSPTLPCCVQPHWAVHGVPTPLEGEDGVMGEGVPVHREPHGANIWLLDQRSCQQALRGAPGDPTCPQPGLVHTLQRGVPGGALWGGRAPEAERPCAVSAGLSAPTPAGGSGRHPPLSLGPPPCSLHLESSLPSLSSSATPLQRPS